MRINNKIALLMISASVLPLMALALIFCINDRVAADNFFYAHLDVMTKRAQEMVNSHIQDEKIRIADWASDGHLRDAAESIIQSNAPEEVQDLANYLLRKNYLMKYKMALDPHIITTDIFDLDGKIIISTDMNRVGHVDSGEELEREYSFGKARAAEYGQVFISEIDPLSDDRNEFPEAAFNASVPLVSVATSETIGVMVIHVSTADLRAVLAEFIKEDLALGGYSYLPHQSLKLSVIDNSGRVIESSGSNALVDQSVADLPPIQACFRKNSNFIGRYTDKDGRSVLGTAICSSARPWLVLGEVSEDEVLAYFNRHLLATLFFMAVIILIMALVSVVCTRHWFREERGPK